MPQWLIRSGRLGSTSTLFTLALLLAAPLTNAQVIINEQFDGNSVDTSIFTFAGSAEPGTFGRTLLRSPNLIGQSNLPFDPPPVENGTLRLRLETFSPFATSPDSFLNGGSSTGVLFLSDEIRTIQTFAPTTEAAFSFETRARFVDDAANPLLPGVVGGAFLFGLDPNFGDDNFVRDEIDFELLSNMPQDFITTNIFNDDQFDIAGRFEIAFLDGLDLTEFNDFRIETTLETTRFFVNDQLLREESTDLALDPQDFRLNINAPAAGFASAFSSLLQPTSNPTQNQTVIFEVDSLVIAQFDPNDSPPPVDPPPGSALQLIDLTSFAVPDFTFGSFATGALSADGFIVDLPATGDNFGGAGFGSSLIGMGNEVTPDTELLVEAIIGPENDNDLVVAIREASGEFFSLSVSADDLADDGQAIVRVGDFFFNGDTDDGIPNEAIIEATFQTPFGQGNAIDAIFQRISVVADIIAGDFNEDGMVDGADFVLFRDGGSPNANALADFQVFLDNFGNTAASSAASSVAVVPEPSAVGLLFAGLVAFGVSRVGTGR